MLQAPGNCRIVQRGRLTSAVFPSFAQHFTSKSCHIFCSLLHFSHYQSIIIYYAYRVTSSNCHFAHRRLQRPWLSLWESCQPNRLTERVLRLMIGSVHWNVGPSQSAPMGQPALPKGEPRSLRSVTYQLRAPLLAKLQYVSMLCKAASHHRICPPRDFSGRAFSDSLFIKAMPVAAGVQPAVSSQLHPGFGVSFGI